MSPTLSPDAEVFFRVFNALRFPLIACDLRRLAWGLRTFPNGPSHVKASLEAAVPGRRAAFSAAIGGFLSAIEPDADDVATLAEELQRRDDTLRTAFLKMADERDNVFVGELGDLIVWEELSLWPLACSGVVQQLLRILDLHMRLIQRQVEGMAGVSILSEYPRHLPTAVHYAMGSLGAWAGGAANMQYFGLFATSASLRDAGLDAAQAEQMGYTAPQAAMLAASGFVPLSDSVIGPLLEAQQHDTPTIIGSIGIDELNLANGPAAVDPGPARNGFLFDTHYRAAFRARDLAPLGLYGAGDVLRDHYAAFYEALPTSGLVRCKHYCAPVVDVSGLDDARRIVAAVPLHGTGGLFFRGQGRLHRLERSPFIRRLLFASSCSDEPSLPSAATRPPGFDYDSLHFLLRHFLAERLDRWELPPAGNTPPPDSPWQAACESPVCELDFAIMALAQHYGIPTHGLDVTTDLEVALWFALNRFERCDDGTCSYRQLTPSDWSAGRERWPVVLVCQHVTTSIRGSLHLCHDLESFGLVAARPRLQSARFFLGGHSDHRNRLAETLVCVLRLSPGDYGLGMTFDSLFPSPEQDLAYRMMLDFADRRAYQPFGARLVNRFRHGAA